MPNTYYEVVLSNEYDSDPQVLAVHPTREMAEQSVRACRESGMKADLLAIEEMVVYDQPLRAVRVFDSTNGRTPKERKSLLWPDEPDSKIEGMGHSMDQYPALPQVIVCRLDPERAQEESARLYAEALAERDARLAADGNRRLKALRAEQERLAARIAELESASQASR